MNKTSLFAGLGAVALGFGFTSPVWAEDGQPPVAAPEKMGLIEEVVVQARRRDEVQQDVPMAITAISGGALRSQGVVTTQDLVQRVPGLQIIPGTGRRDTVTVGIRSQLNIQSRLDNDPAIGVYFAEVNVARPYGLNQGLYDMASVQVLKGPQGTLFGRNTTGGAILFQPNRPTDRFEGSVEVELGNYDGRVFTGVANVPIMSGLSVRLAGRLAKREGFARNLLNGVRLDDVDNHSVRVGVLFRPNDRFENYLVYDSYRSDDNGAVSVIVAARPTAVGSLFFPGLQAELAAQQARGFRDVALDGRNASRVKVDGLSNTTTVELGAVTLKNILGWRRTDLLAFNDFDGTRFPILHVGLDGDAEQISNEFQVKGKAFGDSLDWIGGAYYFKEDGSDKTPLFGLGGLLNFTNGGQAKNISKSVFLQGVYTPPSLPELSLTLGYRYTWDERSILFQPVLSNGVCGFTIGGIPANPCAVPGKTNFSAPTWTLGLDYDVTEDTLLYVVSRRGYRSGGFNITSRTEIVAFPPFRPEKVTDVEAGLKSDWTLGGMPVRTNFAAYYAKGKDLQRSVRVGVAGTSRIINAARAEFYGVEFEGIIRPAPGLTLSAFYSHDEAKYDEFVTGGVDVSASKFPSAPEDKFGFSVRYERRLSGDLGELALSFDYYTRSSMFADPISVLEPESRIEGYEVANLRVEWSDIGGAPVDVAVFGRNIFDETYAGSGSAFQRDFGVTVVQPAEPRMYGVQVRFRFGQ